MYTYVHTCIVVWNIYKIGEKLKINGIVIYKKYIKFDKWHKGMELILLTRCVQKNMEEKAHHICILLYTYVHTCVRMFSRV